MIRDYYYCVFKYNWNTLYSNYSIKIKTNTIYSGNVCTFLNSVLDSLHKEIGGDRMNNNESLKTILTKIELTKTQRKRAEELYTSICNAISEKSQLEIDHYAQGSFAI